MSQHHPGELFAETSLTLRLHLYKYYPHWGLKSIESADFGLFGVWSLKIKP